MAHRKQPERRTFLQDRFEILIRRQKSGKATFNELTELDEIVNRDPELREKVIRESMLMQDHNDFEDLSSGPENKTALQTSPPVRQNSLAKIKAFLNKLFLAKTLATKSQLPAFRPGPVILI